MRKIKDFAVLLLLVVYAAPGFSEEKKAEKTAAEKAPAEKADNEKPAPKTAEKKPDASPEKKPVEKATSHSEVRWTLEEVKKIAIEHNPDLKSARANYEAASSGVGIALSAYLPHVDLSAKFDETTLPSPSAGSTPLLGQALPYKMAVVSVNQTVFDFGKALSRISENRSLGRAAEQEAVAVKNTVELAVQKAFYDVESTAQLVEVADKGLKKFLETNRRTEVLVRTGAKPKFDLSQSKVEVAKAKLVFINAQNAHDLAKIALLNLMGLQEQVSFELVDEGTPKEFVGVSSEKLQLPTLIEKALTARPEMQKQRYSFEAARFEHSAQIREYFPTLSLQAWDARMLPDYPPILANSWGVSLVGTWHIFSGLETNFRVHEAAARMDSQQALVEKEKLTITAEVTRGYKDLVRSESNLLVADEALDAAKENYVLAQKRYDANVATILELLIAESALLGSEATAVTARYDHDTALATLRRVVNAPLRE